MFRTVYASWSLENAWTTLRAVFHRSAARNDALGLSSLLHLGPSIFVQMIEGPEENVRALMRSIELDRRHVLVWRLDETPWSRSFSPALTLGLLDEQDPLGARNRRDLRAAAVASDAAAQRRVASALLDEGMSKYPSMALPRTGRVAA